MHFSPLIVSHLSVGCSPNRRIRCRSEGVEPCDVSTPVGAPLIRSSRPSSPTAAPVTSRWAIRNFRANLGTDIADQVLADVEPEPVRAWIASLTRTRPMRSHPMSLGPAHRVLRDGEREAGRIHASVVSRRAWAARPRGVAMAGRTRPRRAGAPERPGGFGTLSQQPWKHPLGSGTLRQAQVSMIESKIFRTGGRGR